MNIVQLALLIVLALALLLLGAWQYYERVSNPRVMRELVENPHGERAQKVMLLTLPSGRRIPVNYLREGEMVYAGADGRWWKELEGEPARVGLLLRGEELRGQARAILDDPEYTSRIFAKLRPRALEGFGRLIEIRLSARETPQ